MADLSDVEQALATLIGGVVYPNGTSSPSIVLNDAAQAVLVKIFRGWPQPAALDADLAAGRANVSIFSRGVTERNTTRYPVDYQTVSFPAPTVTAAVLNNTVTIGGGPTVGVTQYVTIHIGPRFVTSYAVLASDTPSTIAAALAALIQASFAVATAVGPVITVSSSAYMSAIVGTQASQLAEVRRQMTQIQITLWCATPTVRDNIAKAIEPTLALQTFLTLPDTSACRFRYNNTVVSDGAEKVQLYRRDLIYTAEYATTAPDNAWEVTDVLLNEDVNDGAGGVAPPVGVNVPIPQNPIPPVNAKTPFKPLTPN